jgi:hypothetical protein
MQFSKTEILRNGQKAVLVWFQAISREMWIPKSLLMHGSIRFVGEHGLLIVPDWKGQELIDELGLEEPTYTDAYKDGFAEGYDTGYRDGYTAATAQDSTERGLSQPKPHSIYRKLVAKWHPDRDGGNEEVMKDINELWQASRNG